MLCYCSCAGARAQVRGMLGVRCPLPAPQTHALGTTQDPSWEGRTPLNPHPATCCTLGTGHQQLYHSQLTWADTAREQARWCLQHLLAVTCCPGGDLRDPIPKKPPWPAQHPPECWCNLPLRASANLLNAAANLSLNPRAILSLKTGANLSRNPRKC